MKTLKILLTIVAQLLFLTCLFSQPNAEFESFAEKALIASDSNKISLSIKNVCVGCSYFWDFGDKSYKTEAIGITSHNYAKAGVYNICLTVKNTSNLKDSYCKDVVIQASNILNTDIRKENMMAFTVNTFGADSIKINPIFTGSDSLIYFWEFGDGNTSAILNPGHRYEKIGLYLVKMAVYDKYNKRLYRYVQAVKMGTPNCQAKFNYITDTTNGWIFSNASTNSTAYYWALGDGNFNYNNTPGTYKPSKPGIYEVILVAYNDTSGCIDYYSERLRYGNAICNAEFDYFIDSTTRTAYFRNQSLGALEKYAWIFGDGKVSNLSNPIHTFVKDGYYTVGLTVKTPNCIDFNKKTLLVGSMGEDCQANFSYHSSESYSVKFLDKTEGVIKSRLWSFGDGTTDTARNPLHHYVDPGHYTVCLNVDNGKVRNMSCKKVTAVDNTATNYDGKCKAEFEFLVDSASKTLYIKDKTFNGGTAIVKRIWNFGDGDTAMTIEPTHTYTNSGYYKVSLEILNNRNCLSRDYKLVNVAAPVSKLKAAFVIDTSKINQKASGFPVDFVAISHGDAAKLKWTINGAEVDSNSILLLDQQLKYNDSAYVCLQVSDPVTNQSDTYCEYIYKTSSINSIQSNINSIKSYPNPANSSVTISFSLTEPSLVKTYLTEMAGKNYYELGITNLLEGSNELSYNLNGIIPGIYILEVSTNKAKVAQKLIIIK